MGKLRLEHVAMLLREREVALCNLELRSHFVMPRKLVILASSQSNPIVQPPKCESSSQAETRAPCHQSRTTSS